MTKSRRTTTVDGARAGASSVRGESDTQGAGAPAPRGGEEATWLARRFRFAERGTTLQSELRGGVVTFFAMAYIVVLNPLIIGGFAADQAAVDVAGGWLPASQVAAVTALAAGVLTLLIGAISNLPFGIAAGLGINSFLAVALVKQVTWPEAMGLVLIEGLIIVLLAATGLRRMIFTAIPAQLKTAITVGIGLFIALIGFVDAGFVTAGAGTPVQLGRDGSIATVPTLMFVITLIVMGVLVARRVRGAILITIIGMTVVSMIVEAIWHLGSRVTNPGGWSLSVPSLTGAPVSLPDLSLIGQVSFGAFDRIGWLAGIMLVFTLLFTNFFDAMGSMTGLARAAGLADRDGSFPGMRSGLIIEGVGAVAGGATSSSSNTVFVDSAAGIGEGARTGVASIVTGLLFIAAMFLTPLTQLVPLEIAAAALVIVGALMMTQIKDIEWNDFSSTLPVFITIVVMPFTYSIADGIGAGFVSWVLIRALSGRAREINWLLWVVAAGFVVYFARGPIGELLPH